MERLIELFIVPEMETVLTTELRDVLLQQHVRVTHVANPFMHLGALRQRGQQCLKGCHTQVADVPSVCVMSPNKRIEWTLVLWGQGDTFGTEAVHTALAKFIQQLRDR